ncbi:PREDICTED: uncharacterized protein LOC108563431 isoform X2 [Nicrophorus vespilloides]|uniref:Uncharacterized protein LOC108563431 isoform X2 n=1 Tax=Nicrophorus vespilloides TaxID=110193 RepID=A0ABM1MSP5_NICVS|nr:PREDICTED: uncharacterized protein LOC108563431 isoform X2 [Nicrophorus vespilloides]
MSKSIRYTGYTIVPWYSSSEWKHVYTLLCNKNKQRDALQQAMDIITLWKTRQDLLPSGIEGTLCLIEAILINEETVTERQYSQLCASSVMRFLNVCVASRAPTNSFTKVAKQSNIPDFIIQMRHNFAHSHKLPKPSMLKLALNECFNWVKETYWHQNLLLINDHIANGCFDPNISKLIHIYANLCYYYGQDLDVPDYILNYLDEFAMDSTKKVPVDRVLKEIEKMIPKVTDLTCVIKDVVKSNCFFINPIEIDSFGKSGESYKNIAKLLILLHEKNSIVPLMKEMCLLLEDEYELPVNRVSVALWINEILKGFLKTRDIECNDFLGIGIKFRNIEKEQIEDIGNLKACLFSGPILYNKLYFKSFMAFTLNYGIEDCDEYIKGLTRALDKKYNHTALMEIDDCGDLQAQLGFHMPNDGLANGCNGVNGFSGDESLDEIGEPPKKKTRWNVVKETSLFEKYAIGVFPTEITF